MSLMWSKVSSLQFSYWLGQAGIVHIGLDQRVLTAVSEIRGKKYLKGRLPRTSPSTTSTWAARWHVHTYIYIYIYMCVCVCVYIYIYMCVYVCIYIYIYICMCIYIYIYIYIHVYTYVLIYEYIHILLYHMIVYNYIRLYHINYWSY